MADIDYNALGQVLDTTWGRSSTPKTASFSTKFKLAGTDGLIASYAAIVNFASERQMIEMKRVYEKESVAVIDAELKRIKENYKSITGDSLKFKEVSTTDSVEIIGFEVHNPKRTAYYKRQTVLEIG